MAVRKGTLLQWLVEDSMRLCPMTTLLIDDMHTLSTSHQAGCRSLISHLVGKYVSNVKWRKHVTIVSLEEYDKGRLVRDRSLPASGVSVITQLDLDPNESVASFLDQDSAAWKVLLSGRADGVANVLVIDSLTPLVMLAHANSEEMSTKRVTAWIYGLCHYYSHVFMHLHADVFDGHVESSISNVCNAIVDLRLQSGGGHVECCNLKPGEIHTYVTIRHKHPRTHYKVSRQHEHLRVNGQSVEYISSEQLARPVADPPSDPSPGITFNLSLNEEALEARNKLILPYIKQSNTSSTAQEAKGQIIYHYDKFDDFDEDDDPDDDLDF